MSSENGGDVAFAQPFPINGDRLLVNGMSNGHSSSSSKHRSSSSSHKSSSKDKHRSSSSSSKSHSSSRKDGSSRDKVSSSSSHKSSSRDRERHRSDKDKHSSSGGGGSSSSSSRHKETEEERAMRKEKERAQRKEKERAERENGNGTQDDKSRSSGVSSSSSSRDKDRGHKSSSSSSKQKHSSSSSSSKHRSSSSKHHSSSKSSSSRDKDRHHQTNSHESNGVVKLERMDEDVRVDVEADEHVAVDHIKTEMNVSQASSCNYSLSQFNPNESQFAAKQEPSDEEAYSVNTSVKHELDDPDDGDAPETKRFKVEDPNSEDEDDIPILARKKVKTEKVKKPKKKYHSDDDDNEYDDDEEYDDAPKKKIKKEKKTKAVTTTPRKTAKSAENASPTKSGGRKKKEEEPEEVWKWWEEEKRDDGVKWNFLEHKGPVFAPPYEPLPANVPFEYEGQPMKLSPDAEEIACFYAKMLNHDFTSKPVFNENFFGDWRKAMTSGEREKITKLKHCNFTKMFNHFTAISERNKSRTKEEKAAIKAENEALVLEYGFCKIDGHKEKIGNFRIEPPGLFRGRGEHPKMGKIKKRVMPEDILINCSKDSVVPEPPKGHRWREVKHDNTVTWLASWTENVQGQVKYVMLNPSSKLKGEKDWQKYETARRLHKHIDKIRNTYRDEWKSKEMRIRQRGVALYFIDKLALRAGNEKDEDQADTVGCCSLRVEHIELHKVKDGKENVVVFDFLGKDSIRYYNEVEVEKRVFKNLELFKENKKEGDDLFDRLNTVVMNEHLRELMDGLTAKVFRTYNASWTLQSQLDEMTDPDSTLPEKLLSYNRANRAVAILCNHQRAVPKSHEKSMENLKEKIRLKREQLDDLEHEVKDATKAAKHGSVKEKVIADKKKKQLQRTREQLMKMELQETDRDENKTIALGTSKLNYLDPRISVAWCKKHDVPIEKIYNKTQRDKFRWAIDMATADYHF